MNQASQSIQAHSSNKNNAPNNNQESFEDKTEKFLKSLENTLIKQNNNFLFSFQNILTNVIRKENKTHNEEINQIITQTIKSQLKNSNNTSEESKEASEKSNLTFTFGQKMKKEPLDSKRKKKCC
jgi:signal recognition particle GTPase